MSDEIDNEPGEEERLGPGPRSRLVRVIRFLVRFVIWVVGFFVFVFGGAWFWFESSSSGEVLASKAEAFLEEGLQRDVKIGDLSLRPGLPAKLVVTDVRLANAPGSERSDLASLERIELRLSLRSLLHGNVRISDVVLVKPVFLLEVVRDGGHVTTNLPKWTKPRTDTDTGEVDVNVDSVVIRDGVFELVDHVDDLGVVARAINATIVPDLHDLKKPRASGMVEIASIRFRAVTTEFPSWNAESRARFEENAFWIDSFEAKGHSVELSAQGSIRAHRLDLQATLKAELEKLRETLGISEEMRGTVEAKAEIAGPYRHVEVNGTFVSPDARFDVYEVEGIEGTFGRVDKGFEVVATNGRFEGGTIRARYVAQSREGEPRNVLDIEHEDVVLERLLGIWGIRDSGLLGKCSGGLRLAWDRGNPAEGLSGSTIIVPDDAETKAPFDMAVGGEVVYRLTDGTLHLDPVTIREEAIGIDLQGGIGLRDSTLDLKAEILSTDFAQVDRLWLDLARAFGQEKWELLGVVGRGRIVAAVTGSMKQPLVDIRVNADGFGYGGLSLERADGRVVFDGEKSELLFDGVRFENGPGEIVLNDTIGLGGEALQLGLGVDLHDWDVASVLSFLDLKFPVEGLASGRVVVSGLPREGRATFLPLAIDDDTSTINLSGSVEWTPKEKGLSFDLDVGLTEVPFETVAGVLDLGSDLPLSGATTGTVHLEGPLTDVAGAGSVTMRRGTLLGEQFDEVRSDLVMSEGVFRLRNLDIRMPAGFIRGEAKIDFAQDRFGYVIIDSEIDLERLVGYPSVRSALTGKLILSSSGAGTLEDPEVVLDLRVKDAVLLERPVGEPGVALYATLRDGQFALRGSVGNALTLEGSGALDAATGAIEGRVAIAISNIANVMKRFEDRTGLTTRGRATLNIEIGGALSPIGALVIDGRIDSIDLKLAEHTVRTADAARIRLRDGVLSLDAFKLQVDDQTFTAGGTVSLTTGALDIRTDGLVAAGLLALAMPDLRANGDIRLALVVSGTFDDPSIEGTAEIRDADFRIIGFPQALRNVRSTLVLRENVIEVDSFTANLGGGAVSAGGRIEFDGVTPKGIRIKSQGRGVDLRLSQGLSVEGNFDLLLQGNPAERMRLQGDARFEKVLYTKDIEVGAAIVDFIVARRAKVEVVGQDWESRLSLAVRVDASDAIRVRNNLARLGGSADVEITGTLAQPVLLGNAELDEGGMLRISNVEYRVVNGSITFQNPFRTDPYIDLTAEGRYQNEYDLTIVVTGTPDTLQMAVSSDPPIADLSILNVFGVESDPSGSINTRDAVSSAGQSIIDTGVGSLVGSRLSFADNLRLEGITGPEPKVTIEKSISNDVRAIVSYKMNDAGDNVEVIEWRASPRFVIQATRDSTKDTTYFINAVDVSFSRRFGGHW